MNARSSACIVVAGLGLGIHRSAGAAKDAQIKPVHDIESSASRHVGS